ncbi:uncharacterized protein LOC120084667 [Benincasa hispida]|uniref:uncharacterized protein LOC120084667 n=1 Tax=Benincasa hispida TaxID=102211 RepID=UPI0019005908|nr:uncharacterized protein LOC120084667 [Benincasa hispida]
MEFDFPNEYILTIFIENEMQELETWTMFFDGASNKLGHGIVVILISPKKELFPFVAKLCFDCTHNMIEYEACSMGIQATLNMQIKKLQVLGDSLLVIHQWEMRDTKFLPYKQLITSFSQKLDQITFDYLPKENNQIAYALATLAVMFSVDLNKEVSPIEIGKCAVPASYMNIEEEPNNQSWFHDIK